MIRKSLYLLKALAWTFVLVLLFGCTAWAALALHYDLASSSRDIASAGYLICVIAVLAVLRFKKVAIVVAFGLFSVVLAWWMTIEPVMHAKWRRDVTTLPSVEFDGDRVTIRNIRNNEYRSVTDYDVRYYDKSFNINELTGIDLFLSYWGSPYIAHTILSFSFEGGEHLAVSIETRSREGQEYSAIAGFFKQYELIYVVADERDVVRLRTNYRKEDVYLYHLLPPPEKARAVFRDYLKNIDLLSHEPAFYNAFKRNCTTSIFMSFQVAPPYPPLSLGVLLPGKIDGFLYDMRKARVGIDIPFEEYKKRSYINVAANAADRDPGFSRVIRESLP